MNGMRRSASLLGSLLVLVVAAACGRGAEQGAASAPGAPAAPARATATASAATGTSPTTAASASTATPGPEMVAALEMRRLIGEYTLTDKTLDGVIAVEKDLAGFWADPVQARKIRGERSMTKILAAIDAAPQVKTAISSHGLTPRDYILGSFSTIAAYIWTKASAQDPARVAGQTPPVNAATLAVVQKRLADVTKLLSPPPDRTKPAAKQKNRGKEDD
jgi:hypothetical protein